MSAEYDGVRFSDLPIHEVVWTPERAEHIRTRTRRYGPNENDLEPDWATEAALDARALRGPDASSINGESVRVIGHSPTAGRVLLVVVIPTVHPPTGQWVGITARPATRKSDKPTRSKHDHRQGTARPH